MNLKKAAATVGIAALAVVGVVVLSGEETPMPIGIAGSAVFANDDILTKRTLNSKFVKNDDGSFTMSAHIGFIHYKDKQTGKFENVDARFIPTDYGWEMRKNNYELEIPKTADGWFKFINSTQVDPHTGEDWDLPDEEISMKPLGVSAAEGEVVEKEGWQGKGVVIYRNAYGQDIDLEVMVRNTGFVKEIVINKKPADLSQDLEFSFEVDVGDKIVKPKKKNFGELRSQKKAELQSIRNDAGELEKEGKNKQARQKNKELIKETRKWEDDLERDVWDKNEAFETSDSIILQGLRKTWFKKFNLSDSEGNQGTIKVRIEEVDGKIILTKILDKTFLENAVYPIRTDDTTNFFVGVGDGAVTYTDDVGQQPSQARWDIVHDAGAGTAATDSGANVNTEMQLHGGSDRTSFVRSFWPIDTSGLDDAVIISAAVLKIYQNFQVDDYPSDSESYIAVVETFQVSTSVLEVADYEDCGYGDSGEAGGNAKDANIVLGSNQLDIGSIVDDTYNNFTFNAAGRGWISKTGITKLGVREGHDIEDAFPGDPGEVLKRSRAQAAGSETATTDQDPFLEVTFSLPVTDTGNFFQLF